MKKIISILLSVILTFGMVIAAVPAIAVGENQPVPANFEGISIRYRQTDVPNVIALDFVAQGPNTLKGNGFIVGLKYDETVAKIIQPNGANPVPLTNVTQATKGMPNGNAVINPHPDIPELSNAINTDGNNGGWAEIYTCKIFNGLGIKVEMGVTVSLEQEILDCFGIEGPGKAIRIPEGGLNLFTIYFAPANGKTVADITRDTFDLWQDPLHTDIPSGVSILDAGVNVADDVVWLDFPTFYTLSFNTNGGTPANINSQALLEGETGTAPADPTREGYTFAGWAVGSEDGAAWTFGTSAMPANAVTLFATWTEDEPQLPPDTYTLSFNTNGGTPANIDPQELEEGETGTAPAAPTREGYTFAGWAIGSEDGAAWTFGTSVMPANAVTLFATWTEDEPQLPPDTYTLSFNTNGGTPANIDSQELEEGEEGTAPAAPTREGYTFAGWAIGTENGAAWTFGTSVMPANAIVLVATWTEDEPQLPPDTYTLSFNTNGGTPANIDSQELEEGEAGTAPADPTKEGYAFIGWRIGTENGEAWTFGTSVMPASDVTLVAKWVQTDEPQPDTYTLSFNTNGGSPANIDSQELEEGATGTAPADPTREGYIFAGWAIGTENGEAWIFGTNTMPDSDVTLVAMWVKDQGSNPDPDPNQNPDPNYPNTPDTGTSDSFGFVLLLAAAGLSIVLLSRKRRVTEEK